MSGAVPFIDPHMTQPQGEGLAAQQMRTFPGMAHWAGSGPLGKTCRECSAWCVLPGKKVSYRRDGQGDLQPRRCRTFVSLMRRGDPDIDAGPAVPPDAGACRHFEQASDPALLRANQPVDGLTISHDKEGSKYRLWARHNATGKTVAFRAFIPAVRVVKEELVAVLSRFEWSSDPEGWTDTEARKAALKGWLLA